MEKERSKYNSETDATNIPATTPPSGAAGEESTRLNSTHADEPDADKLDKTNTNLSDPLYNSPKYYCPMHCEGDKTYDKPGNCPICGMHLVELKTSE